MTTQFLLDPTDESTLHVDVTRTRRPVRVAGAFIRGTFDRAVDRFAVNITALLMTFDQCLVALDDDLDTLIEV